MNRARIAALGALDQKNHQECDDRGPRIDHELPGIGPAEYRPGDGPHDNAEYRQSERIRRSDLTLDQAGEAIENGWPCFRHVYLIGWVGYTGMRTGPILCAGPILCVSTPS